MSFDWKLQISKLVLIKQEISDLDLKGLWPHHFPKVAATKNEIAQLEKELQVKLPKEFACFLLHANGWPGFYQYVDLFGTDDLSGGVKHDYALSILEETDVSRSGIHRNDLLPIGATPIDRDLFCLDLKTGVVVWFAGEEIERYLGFEQYFLAMMDYNRDEVRDLQKESQQ